MGQNPSQFKGAQNPVERVSWNDAQAFCEQVRARSGRAIALPTEAQWEYACRAGTETPFNTGSTISTEQANYNGNFMYGNPVKGVHREKTTRVGSFKPNKFGLYDMHGNVWQWCQDLYTEHYENLNPTDPLNINITDGTAHVLRGGSWGSTPGYCRSAFRYYDSPDYRRYNIGFRVVVSGLDE
jgi:formylglycine-generating enzyme required for sulfatase activity